MRRVSGSTNAPTQMTSVPTDTANRGMRTTNAKREMKNPGRT